MPHGQVGYFELHSKDLKESQAFYEKVFGWKFTQEMGPGYLMFDDTTGNVGGGLSKDVAVNTTSWFYVTVDSIEKTLALVAELGCSTVQEKKLIDENIGWWGSFRDPSGNTIGIFEGTQK